MPGNENAIKGKKIRVKLMEDKKQERQYWVWEIYWVGEHLKAETKTKQKVNSADIGKEFISDRSLRPRGLRWRYAWSIQQTTRSARWSKLLRVIWSHMGNARGQIT